MQAEGGGYNFYGAVWSGQSGQLCGLIVKQFTDGLLQKTVQLVFHNESRTKIKIPEKISDKLVMTKNAHSFIIETTWKKFARIGFLKEEDTNFTQCKEGKLTAAPGISIVM